MISFNTGLICIPETFILRNVRGHEFMNHEFMIHLFADVFK